MRRVPRIGWLAMLLIVALAAIGGGWTLWSSNLIINSTIQTGRVHAGFVNAFTDDDDVMNDAARDSGDTDECADIGGVDVDGDGLTSCDPAAPGPDPKERYDKDVARCDASIDPSDSSVAHVVKRNAYPSYHCTAWFDVQNDGSIPVKVAAVALLDMAHDPDSGQVKPAPGAVAPLQPGTVYDVDLDGDTQPDVDLHVRGVEECQQIEPGQSLQMNVGQHVEQTAPQDTTLQYSLAVAMVQWNECPITDLELLGVLVPGIDVRVVGPGNLTKETVSDEAEEEVPPGASSDEPDELPAGQVAIGEERTWRAFNAETGLEYEIRFSQEYLNRVHQFRERQGLTSATEGVDDPDAVEGRNDSVPVGMAGATVALIDPSRLQEAGDLMRANARSNGIDNRTIKNPCPAGAPPCIWPWRAIAHFSNNCTGTLIGPRHLITAAHCINKQGTNNWYSFSWRPARDGGTTPFGTATMPQSGIANWYFTPSGWRACSSDESCGRWDIGIIVNERKGDLTGWMGYAARPASFLNPLSHFNRGYPWCGSSRPDTPVGCQANRLYGDTSSCSLGDYAAPLSNGWNRVIRHTCDTSAGHSGSPVYHYEFDPSLGQVVPVVSMVHYGSLCDGSATDLCGSSDVRPSSSRRITPGVLNTISWLRQTFP